MVNAIPTSQARKQIPSMSEQNMIDPPAGESQNRIAYSIAVASGKGGVGKSTVAVNLAVALAQQGLSVGLMDADIYGPNVPTMMGVTSLPQTEGPKLLPAEAYGVKIISIGFLVPPGQPLIWRGPMLHGARDR
jgi:ATP-binding protein involved in chromosome partitioning